MVRGASTRVADLADRWVHQGKVSDLVGQLHEVPTDARDAHVLDGPVGLTRRNLSTTDAGRAHVGQGTMSFIAEPNHSHEWRRRMGYAGGRATRTTDRTTLRAPDKPSIAQTPEP